MPETELGWPEPSPRLPVVRWGVLLKEGQSLSVMAVSPWLAIVPAGFVLVTVLAFNFFDLCN